jgi:hypothetical protein
VRLADSRDADGLAPVLLDEPRQLSAHTRFEKGDPRRMVKRLHESAFQQVRDHREARREMAQ